MIKFDQNQRTSRDLIFSGVPASRTARRRPSLHVERESAVLKRVARMNFPCARDGIRQETELIAERDPIHTPPARGLFSGRDLTKTRSVNSRSSRFRVSVYHGTLYIWREPVLPGDTRCFRNEIRSCRRVDGEDNGKEHDSLRRYHDYAIAYIRDTCARCKPRERPREKG